ncbi:MAG: pyrroline-5-carboxylate reductase [Bacillota bacterium]|nr:pyrroline-5-carboxylate reductase [Bacillota bacterium]
MSDSQLKIGFIGYGNMASAMAKGLVDFDCAEATQIFACAKDYDKLVRNCALLGIHPCKSAQELVEKVDMVIIAVKPYLVSEVVKGLDFSGKIVISVAVNVRFEDYEEILPAFTHHLSILPNTPVSVGEGIFICEGKHSLSKEEWNQFKYLFGKIALIQTVDTKQMSIAGTIAGCTPAYAAMYLEAMADAAVKHGLPRTIAYDLSAQVMVGTGKMYLVTKTHPGAMKDAVCSPGGTTIKGVAALEKNGFRGTIISAIDAVEGE